MILSSNSRASSSTSANNHFLLISLNTALYLTLPLSVSQESINKSSCHPEAAVLSVMFIKITLRASVTRMHSLRLRYHQSSWKYPTSDWLADSIHQLVSHRDLHANSLLTSRLMPSWACQLTWLAYPVFLTAMNQACRISMLIDIRFYTLKAIIRLADG